MAVLAALAVVGDRDGDRVGVVEVGLGVDLALSTLASPSYKKNTHDLELQKKEREKRSKNKSKIIYIILCIY